MYAVTYMFGRSTLQVTRPTWPNPLGRKSILSGSTMVNGWRFGKSSAETMDFPSIFPGNMMIGAYMAVNVPLNQSIDSRE